MALARDAKGEKFKVVAVIGDGASPVAWHWKQLTMRVICPKLTCW